MDKTLLRFAKPVLLAAAMGVCALPAAAQTDTAEDRAQVIAKLDAAITAVQEAKTAFEGGQQKLAAARANLELADKARQEAEQQLAATEAGAARGRLTREKVDADRALADKANEAVLAVRAEIAAAEAELIDSQDKLAAASAAVEAASASASAFLGDAEAPAEDPAETPAE